MQRTAARCAHPRQVRSARAERRREERQRGGGIGIAAAALKSRALQMQRVPVVLLVAATFGLRYSRGAHNGRTRLLDLRGGGVARDAARIRVSGRLRHEQQGLGSGCGILSRLVGLRARRERRGGDGLRLLLLLLLLLLRGLPVGRVAAGLRVASTQALQVALHGGELRGERSQLLEQEEVLVLERRELLLERHVLHEHSAQLVVRLRLRGLCRHRHREELLRGRSGLRAIVLRAVGGWRGRGPRRAASCARQLEAVAKGLRVREKRGGRGRRRRRRRVDVERRVALGENKAAAREERAVGKARAGGERLPVARGAAGVSIERAERLLWLQRRAVGLRRRRQSHDVRSTRRTGEHEHALWLLLLLLLPFVARVRRRDAQVLVTHADADAEMTRGTVRLERLEARVRVARRVLRLSRREARHLRPKQHLPQFNEAAVRISEYKTRLKENEKSLEYVE